MTARFSPIGKLLILGCIATANVAVPSSAAERPSVSLIRTPDNGLQPQAAVDSDGNLHLIYFQGDPAAGDLYYVRRDDGDSEFSEPLRVNSDPGSVIAVGTIRGGQLAVGRAGRVHVVWNGSGEAAPRVPDAKNDTPMLYTRLNDAGDSFEPQRNLITYAHGLDGGGSVAADGQGRVYVAWHANPAADGEANRRVYLAVSNDEGGRFAKEEPVSDPATGACGCCGLKAFTDHDGHLMILYRAAKEQFYRDMYLLVSRDHGSTFESKVVAQWQIGQCPMSSATFGAGPNKVLAGWETAGKVSFGSIRQSAEGQESLAIADRLSPPGHGDGRKHPSVAVNGRGEILVVWTEGTGWNRGGAVAWQLYDAEGNATNVKGSRPGVPTWSLATAVADSENNFTIVY